MRPAGRSLETPALEARALDRALQDVMGNRRTFGDKVVPVCGVFRQILSIVPRGTNVQVLQLCIRRSMLRGKCKVLCCGKTYVCRQPKLFKMLKSGKSSQNFCSASTWVIRHSRDSIRYHGTWCYWDIWPESKVNLSQTVLILIKNIYSSRYTIHNSICSILNKRTLWKHNHIHCNVCFK